MNYISQFSRKHQERFWNRPLDAVPRYYGSLDSSLTGGVETGELFSDDVPDSVNGFRVAGLTLYATTVTGQIQPTGLRVRLYIAEVRFPGPTANVPTTFDELFLCGGTPYRTEVCWLILPGRHWQATLYNPQGSIVNHCALALDGWYF